MASSASHVANEIGSIREIRCEGETQAAAGNRQADPTYGLTITVEAAADHPQLATADIRKYQRRIHEIAIDLLQFVLERERIAIHFQDVDCGHLTFLCHSMGREEQAQKHDRKCSTARRSTTFTHDKFLVFEARPK
jgi:hypothetical protein